MMEGSSWPHAPQHQLSESGTYFLTAGTYLKQHHFGSRRRLRVLHDLLLEVAAKRAWRLEAWAVFSNHYHLVAHSPTAEDTAKSLRILIGEVHTRSAKQMNLWDDAPGRQVWHNYRETLLTHQASYFARLNYVHQNAVKHGLVPVAHLYPWCSASWFEQTASHAQVQTIYSFKTDEIEVYDDFEVRKE